MNVNQARQIQLLQERGISLVAVQVLQQGLYFCRDQTGVMLGAGAVQPLECSITLVPKGDGEMLIFER